MKATITIKEIEEHINDQLAVYEQKERHAQAHGQLYEVSNFKERRIALLDLLIWLTGRQIKTG